MYYMLIASSAGRQGEPKFLLQKNWLHEPLRITSCLLQENVVLHSIVRINPLLITLKTIFWSWRLDIALANKVPSWPHTWSKTHITLYVLINAFKWSIIHEGWATNLYQFSCKNDNICIVYYKTHMHVQYIFIIHESESCVKYLFE